MMANVSGRFSSVHIPTLKLGRYMGGGQVKIVLIFGVNQNSYGLGKLR
jgi:hypothetical protein